MQRFILWWFKTQKNRAFKDAGERPRFKFKLQYLYYTEVFTFSEARQIKLNRTKYEAGNRMQLDASTCHCFMCATWNPEGQKQRIQKTVDLILINEDDYLPVYRT